MSHGSLPCPARTNGTHAHHGPDFQYSADSSSWSTKTGRYEKPQFPMEILIVGAGIAGLALAGLLGRSGHKVIVLEAAPQIAEVGAGLTCSPNLTRLLSRWGHEDRLRKHTDVLRQISLRRWESGLFLGAAPLMPEVQDKHGAPQYVLHRADLHNVLMEDAHSVSEVRINSMVVSIDFHEPSVTLNDGSTLRADLVIGADGQCCEQQAS
jgi:salicylate hydroxylase